MDLMQGMGSCRTTGRDFWTLHRGERSSHRERVASRRGGSSRNKYDEEAVQSAGVAVWVYGLTYVLK